MSSFVKTLSSNLIVQAILLVIVGAVLLLMPGITMITVVYILAFMLTICGAWAIISVFRNGGPKDGNTPTLVLGIALLIIPILMFIMPNVVAEFISLLVGILLIVSGMLNCVRSFEIRKDSSNTWKISMVISIIIACAGILLLCNPFAAASLFVQVLGISLIANGISDLLLFVWNKN